MSFRNRALLAGALASVLGCQDESSPLNTVPVAPSHLTHVSAASHTGQVGLALPTKLVVRVQDHYGNPVPDVPVTFVVDSGGGSVFPATVTTDTSGTVRATWTLGTRTGGNGVSAQVTGLPAASFTAAAQPGPPSRIAKLSGDNQTAQITSTLPDELVAQVLDGYDNVVATATPVQWTVTAEGGALTSASGTTDASGHVRARWTLGTRSGQPMVSIGAGSISASFVATAQPGAPVALVKSAGDAQTGPSGVALADSLAVQVRDQYANPVANVPVTWSASAGTITASRASTAGDGINRAQWRLGAGTGEQTATATAANLAPVAFTATAQGDFNLTLVKAVISQAIQNAAGSIPLIEDRPAFMQVHLTATQSTPSQPVVRVRFFQGGNQVAELSDDGPDGGVPTTVTEGNLDRTVNFAIPAALMRRGTTMLVHVDPANAFAEFDETDNVLPRGGAAGALDVRAIPTFNVRFVPVNTGGLTGAISEANKEQFLADARKLLPVGVIDADVRQTFTSQYSTLGSTGTNWSNVLNELQLLRNTDGSQRHYYGVVKVSYFSGVAGLGYVGFPAAMGWDYVSSGPGTAAHEWGHNFNRLHAPCGGPSQVDQAFPYSNGSIGTYGIDVATGTLKSPATYADFMSYCSPEWISDYNFKAIMDYRGTQAASAAIAARPAPTTVLMLWGRVNDREAVLEPAFSMTTVPSTPAPGPYRIEGRDAAGALVFLTTFSAARVEDIPDNERQFAFALPLAPSDIERVASLRLIADGKEARLETSALRAPERRRELTRVPLRELRRTNEGMSMRLAWDGARYPFVVVRDPRSGEVVAFGRQGLLSLRATGELDVIVSDGVQSVPVRLPR